jgi:hypothetical protein
MNCENCKIEAPETLRSLTPTWLCPICTEKPFEHFLPLKTVMQTIYEECKQLNQQVKMVYVSDLDNNLDKINKHFRESVMLDNPFCTITLTLPNGVPLLNGPYDFIFVDGDIPDKNRIVYLVGAMPTTQMYEVEPIKQNVLTSD